MMTGPVEPTPCNQNLAALTYLLALPVSQVALTQHETTGANVHLTPRTDEPHILLHIQETQLRDVSHLSNSTLLPYFVFC